MSFHHLDEYADVSSPLTRLAPVSRVMGTMVLAIGAATLPMGAWLQMGLLASLVLALAVAARIPPATFALRMTGPLSLVLLASAGLLFLVPGTQLWAAGPLRITDEGLRRFVSVLGRSMPALGAAVILVSTLRFTELLEALRELRLPQVMITSLGLAYRFLYTLMDEVERIRRAARSRNASQGTASRRYLVVGIAAASLARSFARSERVHRAMLARGFRGLLPQLHVHQMDDGSVAALTGLTAVVLTVAMSARL